MSLAPNPRIPAAETAGGPLKLYVWSDDNWEDPVHLFALASSEEHARALLVAQGVHHELGQPEVYDVPTAVIL